MINFFPVTLFTLSEVLWTLMMDGKRHPIPASACVRACVCVDEFHSVGKKEQIWTYSERTALRISSLSVVEKGANFNLSSVKVPTLLISSVPQLTKGKSELITSTSGNFKRFWYPETLELIRLGLQWSLDCATGEWPFAAVALYNTGAIFHHSSNAQLDNRGMIFHHGCITGKDITHAVQCSHFKEDSRRKWSQPVNYDTHSTFCCIMQ